MQTPIRLAGQNIDLPDLLTRIILVGIQFLGIMRFALLAGLASLASSVTATALTYRLEANEKACFYTDVDSVNAKVAFYFAVGLAMDYRSSTLLQFDV